MSERATSVSALLHEAAETHHQVFRITDGVDEDWATWYSDWLINLSELPKVLETTPARSALTSALVALEREFADRGSDERWEDYYARVLVERFRPA